MSDADDCVRRIGGEKKQNNCTIALTKLAAVSDRPPISKAPGALDRLVVALGEGLGRRFLAMVHEPAAMLRRSDTRFRGGDYFSFCG